MTYFPIDPVAGSLTIGDVGNTLTITPGSTSSTGIVLSQSGTGGISLTAPLTLTASTTGTVGGSVTYVSPMGAVDPATLPNVSGIGAANHLSQWKPGFSGGTPGAVANNQQAQTIVYGAPNSYIWNATDQLNFVGTGGTGQHVARYEQTLRGSYASGGATNNPQLWAGVGEMRDQTGQKSSVTNANLSWEFDNVGNNVDDANARQGIVVVVMKNAAIGAGVPQEVSTAYSTFASNYDQVKVHYNAGGNYQVAAFDTRYATGDGTAGAMPAPTVTANSSGTTVAVSNVMPFTSNSRGIDINHGPATATIWINGIQHTQTAYAFTGFGPAGTLTLSSPATVASGQSVVNNSKTFWLADKQQIAFDTTGDHYLAYDPVSQTIRAKGNNIFSLPIDRGMAVGWVLFYSASITVPWYQSGSFIALSQTTPQTLTLPAASTVAAGTGYIISNEGIAAWTLALNGTDTAATILSLSIRPYDRMFIVSDGAGTWHEVWRSNAYTQVFGTPASSSAAGAQGQMMFDASYLYCCVSSNVWMRTALSSF